MLVYRELSYQDYISALENLILPEELFIPQVYNNGDNNATIGYGYNLVTRSNNVANFQQAGIALTSAQTAVLAEIDSQVASGVDRTSITQYATQNFNATITETEARQLFRVILPEYEARAIELGMPYSPERVAFVSLCYNRGVNNPRLGPVIQAISVGDRAETWFQIQYNSQTTNPLFVNGIANRRYREAATFGLYNNSPGEIDHKSAYRMFTRHKAEILGADGSLGGANGYEDRYPPPEAGMSIFWQLKAARDYLLPLYDQGVAIAWSHIYVGESDGTDGTQNTLYYKGTDTDLLK